MTELFVKMAGAVRSLRQQPSSVNVRMAILANTVKIVSII